MKYINAEMEIVFFEDLDVITTSNAEEITSTGGLINGGIGEGDSGKFEDLFPNL